jgi:hypothetical protein
VDPLGVEGCGWDAGKSPIVVFGDEDLDAAAQAVVEGFTGNTDQMCVAATRLIVDEAVHGAFVRKVVELAAAPASDRSSHARLWRGWMQKWRRRRSWGPRCCCPAGEQQVRPEPTRASADGFFVNPVRSTGRLIGRVGGTHGRAGSGTTPRG